MEQCSCDAVYTKRCGSQAAPIGCRGKCCVTSTGNIIRAAGRRLSYFPTIGGTRDRSENRYEDFLF